MRKQKARPKLKSKRAAVKRFKLTATGKVKRGQAAVSGGVLRPLEK